MRGRWPIAIVVSCSAGFLGACHGTDSYTVVTIDTRPAVREAATLKVTLSNEESMKVTNIDVGTHGFPATFSVSAPGRAGDLGIAVDALDRDGLLVGRGAATTSINAPTASLMLEPADFVVNTDFADDQLLSNYTAADGFQLSATADGTWTTVYNATCATTCDLFARRFDASGKPVETAVAAGTNSFKVNSNPTTFFTTPSVASAGTATVAIWNFDDPAPATTKGIACRTLDANGAVNPTQVQVSSDELPDLVSVTPMSNGNFAVAWDGTITSVRKIRSAIVRPDCTTQSGTGLDVSTLTGTTSPRHSSVTTSGDKIMYAWTLDGAVHVRIATNANVFVTNDTVLIPKTATEEVEYVRVAPLSMGGFAVFPRWALQTGSMGPGRIEMWRTDGNGMPKGTVTLVTDRSGSDFASSESFGVATRSDGALLVVWHACGNLGDGSGCGAFGRVLRPTGVPVGDTFSLATTTDNDQTGPSAIGLPGNAFAAAWTDRSGAAPDKSGASVRARILYPAFDDAAAVIGAKCNAADAAPCGNNLACGQGSDGTARCFTTCNPGGTPPLCPGGGTCTTVQGGAAACLF
jgi:hypothetical protein